MAAEVAGIWLTLPGPAMATGTAQDGNDDNQRGLIRATDDLRSSGEGYSGNLGNHSRQPRECSNKADKMPLVSLVDLVDLKIRLNKNKIVIGVFRGKKQLNKKSCLLWQLWQPGGRDRPDPMMQRRHSALFAKRTFCE